MNTDVDCGCKGLFLDAEISSNGLDAVGTPSDPGWQNFRAATLTKNGFTALAPDTDLQAFATAFHDQFHNLS